MVFNDILLVKKIESLCLKHGVNSLFAFGSVLRKDFDEKTSDIDLIVDINFSNPIEKGEHLMALWNDLELLFGKKVDLISVQAVKNPILKLEIDNTKKLIYAA